MSGMRSAFRLSVLAVALAACGSEASPWPAAPATGLDLRLSLQPNEVELMQPVTATLDLFTAADLAVDFAPEAAIDREQWRVEVAHEPVRPLFGGQWRRTVLQLRPRRGPGPLLVPSFRAAAKDGASAASTPEQTVVVRSSLGLAPSPTVPDLTAELGQQVETRGELFAAPRVLWPWAVAAGAVVVLSLFVWWLRRPRARSFASEVASPPHVRALRELQRLRDSARSTPAQVDAFYVATSQVLRDYVEERFAVRAPERTTEEFLRELELGGDTGAAGGASDLLRGHRGELARFLLQCDMVKFARHLPAESEHLATWESAVAFVEATRPDRVVAPAAAPAVAAVGGGT